MSEKKRGNKSASNANYMMLMTALAIAIVVIVNLICNSLNIKYTMFDLSRKDIFTLTDTTKEYLKSLEDDITIITLTNANAKTDGDLQKLLKVYESENSHISLMTVDSAKRNDIVTKYVSDVQSPSNNSVVVVCGDKFKFIDYKDMVEAVEIDNSSSYQYIEYDMEGEITRAIDYVTSDQSTKAYVLTGGGKSGLGLTEYAIEKQNIDVEELDIRDEGEIPEDADLVIISCVTKDLSDNEFEQLNAYMDRSGTLFIAEEYESLKTGAKLENYDALLERYGMSVEHVTVLEQSSSYYYTSDTGGFPFQVKPVLRKHDITNQFIEKDRDFLLIMSDKIDIKEKKNVEVIPLMESSGTAYYKSKSDGSMAKQNTDPSGTYTYVAAAIETLESGAQSKLIYSAAFNLLNREYTDAINDTLANNNASFVVESMKWLTGQEDTVYVDSKSKSYNRLIYVKDVEKKIGYLTVGIPVAVLLFGGVVWYRRRKK